MSMPLPFSMCSLKERMTYVRENPDIFSLALEEARVLKPKWSRTPVDRDADIMRQRLIEGRSLEAIGIRHNISRERVRQIEGRTWRRIQRLSN